MSSENLTEKRYIVVSAGTSTAALLFCTNDNDAEVYIGNQTDIDLEAENLQLSGFMKDSKLLDHLRKENKLERPYIKQGSKHYDIEDVIQGDKITACIIRSVHESHGKLIPNTITFAIDPALVNSQTIYPIALEWVKTRAKAFAGILESEGMKPDSEFILNSFIYALDDAHRLDRFKQADRGCQTVTEGMLI
ncbi:MAG: hypothetical protein ACI9TY_000064 [Alphaproteobacteria bacterium]